MEQKQELRSISSIASAVGVSHAVASRWFADGMPAAVLDPPRFDPETAINWLIDNQRITVEWAVVVKRNLGGNGCR